MRRLVGALAKAVTGHRTPKSVNYVLGVLVLLVCASYYEQPTQNPPGFYLDESSICYNAYTISQTGQDEYGERWPLYFRAFGEYKNPLYIYVLALIFRIFGPSILLARLLSISLGVAAVLALVYLTFLITRQFMIAATVGLSAALTPWLFENSRLVFEVAMYPLLVCLFLIALFRASQQEKWRWYHSISIAITLALLTYSYSIGRLLAPLFAIGLAFFITRKRLWSIATTWLVYGLTLVPALVFHLRHPGVLMNRFWLLTYLDPESTYSQMLGEFLRHYFANINPWTIAVTGENNVRDHVGTMGSILAPTLLLMIVGMVLVLMYSRREAWWRFMLYAVLVAVIPASLTTTQFPQIRLVALPVLLHVFTAPALIWLTSFDRLANRRWKTAVLAVLVLAIMVQGLIFRLQFRRAGPQRWYIFDEQFTREVLPTALAQKQTPIYFYDPPGKSGYVQAYWHGTLQGLPAAKFVRVTDASPANGAVVISTAEECSDCRMLLKSINYIVYVVERPKPSSAHK